MKSRPKTVDEMRQEFIDHVRVMVDYWADLPDVDRVTGERLSTHGRISGFAHSMLAAISGCSMALPSFDMVPSPHPDDRDFLRKEGEDWWVKRDINDGSLHSHLYNLGPNAAAWNREARRRAHREAVTTTGTDSPGNSTGADKVPK